MDDMGIYTDNQAESWAKRFDEAMRTRRMTNAEMERLTGVGRKSIGEYRAGSTTPPFTAMAAMARELGVTCEWLATGEESAPAYVSEARALLHPTAQPAPVLTEKRLTIAQLQLEEAMQAVGLIPSEALRQALMVLLVRCDVPAHYIAELLLALKRPGDPVK